jgi:hypothetical protein
MLKRTVIFIACALLSSPAFAVNEFSNGETVVRVRDKEGELTAALGQPTRKTSVENARGDHLGDYYYYELTGKSVRFYVEKGRVMEIVVISNK